MPAISIICPVYNAERYLHRCINSILSQTFKDFELILVDDGSPDDSGKICDEYATRDSRIRVFHVTNGGVAIARQLGLDNSIGEYTIHVDPDDWIDSQMLDELYAKAKETNADIVICDFILEQRHRSSYIHQTIKSYCNDEILLQVLNGNIHGSLCNKLVRRTCYTKYSIQIPAELSLWEDRYVICRFLMQNIQVVYLNKAFYHYDCYSNANSITRNHSLKSINSLIYFITAFEELLEGNQCETEFYLMKATAKDWAFGCPEYTYDMFKNLYSEINHKYKKVYNPLRIRFYASISLLLNNKKIPYLIYKILKYIKV